MGASRKVKNRKGPNQATFVLAIPFIPIAAIAGLGVGGVGGLGVGGIFGGIIGFILGLITGSVSTRIFSITENSLGMLIDGSINVAANAVSPLAPTLLQVPGIFN